MPDCLSVQHGIDLNLEETSNPILHCGGTANIVFVYVVSLIAVRIRTVAFVSSLRF